MPTQRHAHNATHRPEGQLADQQARRASQWPTQGRLHQTTPHVNSQHVPHNGASQHTPGASGIALSTAAASSVSMSFNSCSNSSSSAAVKLPANISSISCTLCHVRPAHGYCYHGKSKRTFWVSIAAAESSMIRSASSTLICCNHSEQTALRQHIAQGTRTWCSMFNAAVPDWMPFRNSTFCVSHSIVLTISCSFNSLPSI